MTGEIGTLILQRMSDVPVVSFSLTLVESSARVQKE